MRIFVISCLVLLQCACTWVKLTAAGAEVEVAIQSDVSECRRLGTTRSITKSAVGRVNRSEKKVNTETLTIARNEAARMGGNTIVPSGEVIAGEREFVVFNCTN